MQASRVWLQQNKRTIGTATLFLVALASKLTADIRPELLQYVRRHVDPQLHTKLGNCVASRSVIWIVCIRNRHCRLVADDLRIIELRVPRIRAGPENLARRTP